MISGATKQELEIANARAELLLEIKDKDKEIERLNNEIKTLLKENGNKEKIIIKQNNIMDELENFIKTYAIPELTLKEPHKYFMEINIILDKLKELKGGE